MDDPQDNTAQPDTDDDFQQNPGEDLREETRDPDGEKLAGDYSPPGAPPSGVIDHISRNHPAADQGLDANDVYDASVEAASGVEPPKPATGDTGEPPVPDE